MEKLEIKYHEHPNTFLSLMSTNSFVCRLGDEKFMKEMEKLEIKYHEHPNTFLSLMSTDSFVCRLGDEMSQKLEIKYQGNTEEFISVMRNSSYLRKMETSNFDSDVKGFKDKTGYSDDDMDILFKRKSFARNFCGEIFLENVLFFQTIFGKADMIRLLKTDAISYRLNEVGFRENLEFWLNGIKEKNLFVTIFQKSAKQMIEGAERMKDLFAKVEVSIFYSLVNRVDIANRILEDNEFYQWIVQQINAPENDNKKEKIVQMIRKNPIANFRM
jgi:hypothetical protein